MLRDPALIPLSHQHHNALALCVLIERSLRSDRSDRNVALQSQKTIDRYEIELTNHFALEEELLFPAARGCGLTALADELTAEHREFERMVHDLRTTPSASLLLDSAALLRRHVRREENDLFEQIQRLIDRDLLNRLGGELEARAVRVCL
ncbi:MAG: hemerythrin domain-containing protein [Bryobacteraceae bacterium]